MGLSNLVGFFNCIVTEEDACTVSYYSNIAYFSQWISNVTKRYDSYYQNVALFNLTCSDIDPESQKVILYLLSIVINLSTYSVRMFFHMDTILPIKSSDKIGSDCNVGKNLYSNHSVSSTREACEKVEESINTKPLTTSSKQLILHILLLLIYYSDFSYLISKLP